MSMFYAGRHRGSGNTSQVSKRAGATMVAVAAVSLGTATIGAQSASAVTSAQATNATATFSGLVKQGSRGSVVKQVQRKVGVSADGIFGPATRNAVKRWQQRHGLVADGIVGSRTGTKMRLTSGSTTTRSAKTASSAAKSNFTGLVRQGSRGSVVKQVQRVVGASADGIFGSGTASAVKRWQRSHGLTADGVVGPRTGSAMGITGSTRSTSTASRSTTRTAVSGSGVLNTAASLVGTRYVMGGTTTSGFDCSGFTKYVFARNGKTLPRTAEQQRQSTTRVSSPRAGDLVFFGAPAWHVGIYAGNGQMYDAGNSRVDTSKRAIWTSAVTYGRV
ncbi:hypothetical protein ASG73_02295 [Janibacter sp. Soil728]|uniref:C40 family peptidase n=1 Tax=Janibacter sp. Soil728 TaxID=1736393 RepID=UPI0006FC9B40|nr:peptidoglycan-binding protein [Janibacter sp. Soil728]KRE39194.1 hypothetical protein ASG73_02295 [Janibacter sp. Soil728]